MPLTSTGWGVLLGSVAVYAVGAVLGYQELAMLGAGGLLVVVAALVTVARSTTLGAERRVVPDRVTVGEPAEGLLTVTNEGTRRSSPVLGHEVVRRRRSVPTTLASSSAASASGSAIELAVGRLRAREAQTLPFWLPTGRRAVLDVGPFVVTRGDPFGLVERRSSHGEARTLWVHPRVHPIGPLPLGRQRDLEGPTSESARGETVFHSLREYVVGDDLRRVHWKATAHSGSLMVREHADPVRPDATVVLDDRAEVLDPGGFDLAVEVVASVAVAALRGGFPVNVTSTSGAVRTSPTVGDVALLDVLAGVEQRDHDGLDQVTQRLMAGRGGRALVVVTGRPGPEEMPRWAAAGRRFGTVIVVTVAADALPAAPAGVTVLRVGTADDLIVGWRRLQ
jgi:uncharacterized protein (DUF58 family)